MRGSGSFLLVSLVLAGCSLSSIISHVVLDLGLLDVMKLPLQLDFVIDDVFDIGVDLLGDVGEELLPPTHEHVIGLDLIALGHDVVAGGVLGQ